MSGISEQGQKARYERKHFGNILGYPHKSSLGFEYWCQRAFCALLKDNVTETFCVLQTQREVFIILVRLFLHLVETVWNR